MTESFIAFVTSQKNCTIDILNGAVMSLTLSRIQNVTGIELGELSYYSHGKSHFHERQIFFLYISMHSYRNMNE